MSSLDAILKRLTNGEITHAEAELIIRRELKIDEYARVAEIAKLDTARMHRVGIPEVVLAEGKNTEDLLAIVEAQLKAEGRAVITRVSEQQLQALQRLDIEWHARARIAVVGKKPHSQRRGLVGIVCAGTADVSVAEEARVVAARQLSPTTSALQAFTDFTRSFKNYLMQMCSSF
jgi:NCAIR mutase (PurE)-related protein